MRRALPDAISFVKPSRFQTELERPKGWRTLPMICSLAPCENKLAMLDHAALGQLMGPR
jgi:hypothetical protein